MEQPGTLDQLAEQDRQDLQVGRVGGGTGCVWVRGKMKIVSGDNDYEQYDMTWHVHILYQMVWPQKNVLCVTNISDISIKSTTLCLALSSPSSKLNFIFLAPLLAKSTYSPSNVIVVDEKSTSFHQYLRYSHKCGTIAFSTPSAII